MTEEKPRCKLTKNDAVNVTASNIAIPESLIYPLSSFEYSKEGAYQEEDSDNVNTQPHYNSDKSLYKVAEELQLNHWEFDIFKRLVRCRKKGEFEKDLNKIKDTIDIYLKEYER